MWKRKFRFQDCNETRLLVIRLIAALVALLSAFPTRPRISNLQCTGVGCATSWLRKYSGTLPPPLIHLITHLLDRGMASGTKDNGSSHADSLDRRRNHAQYLPCRSEQPTRSTRLLEFLSPRQQNYEARRNRSTNLVLLAARCRRLAPCFHLSPVSQD
jgi:hypothetical protein